MVTFLSLVPEPSPPFSPDATDGGKHDYFTKYDIGKFLCNYETSSVDSMSIASDSDSDVEPELDDADYPRPGALLHLLTNSLILAHIAPFVSAADKLNLAATSKAFHALVHGTPYAFKYLDLTRLERFAAVQDTNTAPAAVSVNLLRHTQWCELPEYRLGPYHDVFNHLHNSRWLSSVNTLILDNTNVDAELVGHLLTSPSCNVRILSLRNTPFLNKESLCTVLQTLCSQTGPGTAPKLKGLYLFSKEASESSGDLWYRERGRVLAASTASDGGDWASTLLACRGKIAFDGVLCNGPRHTISPAFGKVPGLDIDSTDVDLRRIPLSRLPPGEPNAQASMATFSLGGCASCGSAPEGWTTWGDDHTAGGGVVSQFPLLWPPPRLSTNVRVAMCPDGESLHPHKTHGYRGYGETPSPSRFIARCEWCVYGRACACCMRWWCESCLPDSAAHGLASVVDDAGVNSSEVGQAVE